MLRSMRMHALGDYPIEFMGIKPDFLTANQANQATKISIILFISNNIQDPSIFPIENNVTGELAVRMGGQRKRFKVRTIYRIDTNKTRNA